MCGSRRMSSKLDFVEFDDVHQWSRDVTDQLESELKMIETTLKAELETFEKSVAHHFQKEAPDEESSSDRNSLLRLACRIASALKRLTRAREAIVKENGDLRKQFQDQQLLLDEMEMERDVLLQQIHTYLETNSSLRVRLEEQRCQTGTLQRQLNTDLESRIKSLENEKEELSDLNMEKDKQIHKISVMLEQTAKCLKSRETEVLNRRNEENNLVTLLKADLQKALDEKAKTEEKYLNLKERLEDYFLKNAIEGPAPEKKSSLMKRSLSVGDFSWTNINVTDKNTLELQDIDSSTRQIFKNTSEEKLQKSMPWKVQASRSWSSGVVASAQNLGDRPRKPSVHAQLNALRRDLLNVTKKLELLKNQLMSSGVITEESTPPAQNRSLKRKANPMEESGGDVSEEQKSEFKNLKNILQDAKNLNVKLQNLREEKQRIIDLNQKEVGVQITENKKEEFCKTAHGTGLHFGVCKAR